MIKQVLRLCCVCACLAYYNAIAQSSVSNLVDQLAIDVAQRSQDYSTGADLQRDQQLYQNNYWNNGYWSSFWSITTANSSTWQQQMRILKIHSTNCISHLQGTLAWITSTTGIYGDDGLQVTITKRSISSWWQRQQEIVATLNKQKVSTTDYSLWASWNTIKGQLYPLWIGQNATDPNGKFMGQDYEIINRSMPNASEWALATAGHGTQPDSSLISLLINNATSQNLVSDLSTNFTDPGTDALNLNLTNATFESTYASMEAAGAVIRPGAVKQPSDAIASIRAIYNNNNTNPVRLRSQLLQLLFNDIMASGRWQNNTYVFTTLVHSATYKKVFSSYVASLNMLISYYQVVLNKLNVQLQEANQNDQNLLAMVGTYRDQRAQQPPISTVITTAEARQIYNQEVGNTSLKSIPLISIVAYMMWLVGPPWSETPCFPSFWGCTPNPLYNTIVAQLIRGLDKTGGVTIRPQNAAMATIKNATQVETALQDIMDLKTKVANNLLLLKELTNSYGSASYNIDVDKAKSPTSTLPIYQSKDVLVQSTMDGVNNSRQSSQALDTHMQQIHSKLTGSGTLIERAALKNEQETLKTATMEELNRTINNQKVFNAIQRNEALQKQKEKEEAATAGSQGGLQ